ncbi:MAG: LysR family transcriptional regulator [Dermatophilaceae bacterium]
MATLHQLRCFLSVYEHGSFTAAAEDLGYAQPSISEQVRALERSYGVELFTRVGRGVTPTPAGETLRPLAELTIGAAEQADRALRSVRTLESGTVRFGVFGTARLYMGAQLVADMLERHPGVRVELIGQNSTEVEEHLRRGYIEAAMIGVDQLSTEGLHVVPVAREELVYLSMDPERTARPVAAPDLGRAPLVMPETTWRATDPIRAQLRRMVREAGVNPETRIEVEDVETAVELVGRGLADTIVGKGVVTEVVDRLAPGAHWASLEPRQYGTLAIVHRAGATLSPAAQVMVHLATRRIQEVLEPIAPAPDRRGRARRH